MSITRSKWFLPLFSVALGVVMLAALWIGGHAEDGVFSLAVIAGFVVEAARGNDGAPYAWLGALGGLAYLLAIIVLRLRR